MISVDRKLDAQPATVLVVEDHEETLSVISRTLAAGGFDVVWARNGSDTVKLLARHPGRIDVVVADVVLPGMTAPAIVEKVSKKHPDVRAVYVSAYDEDTIREHGVDPDEVCFLPKPCEPADLIRMVSESLQR